MKFLSMMIASAAVFAVAPSAMAKDGDVHEKVVAISDAYIPSGFDSGSEAFVVVNGWFPHSCYKLKDAKVEHIGSFLHQVTTTADVTEGLCLTVIIPFHREVQLGRLGVGEHQIRFMSGDGAYMERRLTIEN